MKGNVSHELVHSFSFVSNNNKCTEYMRQCVCGGGGGYFVCFSSRNYIMSVSVTLWLHVHVHCV